MTIGGFFIVLFVVIGLYGLFKKDDCTITEEDIDELIHELEEEKKNRTFPVYWVLPPLPLQASYPRRTDIRLSIPDSFCYKVSVCCMPGNVPVPTLCALHTSLSVARLRRRP